MVTLTEIEDKALEEIIIIIRNYYGYDFSGYSYASFKRRVARVIDISGLKDAYDLKFRLLNDTAFFSFFLKHLTVNVTEMFRDPDFFRELKEKVFPLLASYPVIKIWHAGCSTGEEVYSMCILLEEAGLLQRCNIYATDINQANLNRAKAGIMPASAMKVYTCNYHKAGGSRDFSDYYTAQYNNVIINKQLIRKVIFSRHNLVSESSFNEFHLVLCRNVMIYFEKELQERVLHLFYESMVSKGFLALGSKESMAFSNLRPVFETLSSSMKIFRRKL